MRSVHTEASAIAIPPRRGTERALMFRPPGEETAPIRTAKRRTIGVNSAASTAVIRKEKR